MSMCNTMKVGAVCITAPFVMIITIRTLLKILEMGRRIKMKESYQGLLIINEFLNADKFSEQSQWLTNAANENHIKLQIKTNAEVLVCLEAGDLKENYIKIHGDLPDFVLFWDKDIRLAMYFEAIGIPVFNSSSAIANCDDKSMTHLLLAKYGITMPKTIFAPMTFANIGYNNYKFLEHVKGQIKFPIVIKECFGSFGAQVYLANDDKELCDIVSKVGAKPMLFQEYIKVSEGKDIRLQVVRGKVITAMYRYSTSGDFRANVSNGGSMKPYKPNKKEIELAIKCCEILDLDFAGVDILFGENDERLVCEVNSNAHFKNIYDCTGVNTANAIIEYIKEKIDK